MDIQAVVHWFIIKVQDKMGGNTIESYKWDGLTWDLRLKYDWYFKYRTALCQVNHPKCYVVASWGNEPAIGKTLKAIINDKIVRKKGKITELTNKINKAKNNWNSLFPIEDDSLYQQAICKLNRLNKELNNLQNDLESDKD